MPNILIFLGFLECDFENIRRKIKENFLILVETYSKIKKEKLSEEIQPAIFFLSFLVKNLLYKINLEKYKEKCDHFFDFICKSLLLLSHEELNYIKQNPSAYFNFQELYQFSLNEFVKSSITEKNEKEKDCILQGFLQLFETLNIIEPKFKESLENNSKFLNHLFFSGLFEMPTGYIKTLGIFNIFFSLGLESPTSILPPKCKNSETREKAFNLLSSLILYESPNALPTHLELVYKFKQLLFGAFWRTNSIMDWSISPFNMEKSLNGYVGLKNLGCTCYMNSLIQQLFMIPYFREEILNIEEKSLFQNDLNDNLLYQFQLILAGLKLSHKQYVDPRKLCFSLKDHDGNPINVLEQMDAHEFFNEFFDRLETILKVSIFS